jgi:signal transduction histidine kinase
VRSRWSSPLKSLFWRSVAAFGTVVVATLLLGALLLGTIVQRGSEHRLAQSLVANAPERGLPGGIAGAGLPAVAFAILGAALLGLIAVYALCRIFARPIARTTVALAGEKQRIDWVIADMAEGVIAIDEDRRVLLVNPAAGRALGLPGPFVGLPLGAAGFPAPLAEALEQVADPTGPGQRQLQFACGGEELHARISRVGTQPEQPCVAVALLQNVTTETQLRRLRENFVANVSHELRGPLASLSAGVEAMHDGMIPEAARPRFLSSILAEIARLRRLVDDLLELSRLDAGTVEIAQEEFDLQPLCEGLADIWEPRISAAGLMLKVECPHLRVVANYDKVEEVLANFLENAIRFTEGGGVIRIFARPEGDFVRAGVADMGVGITKEHLAHIWDRFYKVDPARTRTRDAGTGLGLAIVKQLVERLGGEVAVQSEPGEGSVFSFTLVAAADEGGATG